jgi:hypothetical protein
MTPARIEHPPGPPRSPPTPVPTYGRSHVRRFPLRLYRSGVLRPPARQVIEALDATVSQVGGPRDCPRHLPHRATCLTAPPGSLRHLAHRATWLTAPPGSLRRLADCATWLTAPPGRLRHLAGFHVGGPQRGGEAAATQHSGGANKRSIGAVSWGYSRRRQSGLADWRAVPCRALPWAKRDSRLSQPRLAYSAGAQLVRPHGAPSEGGRRPAGGGGWLSPSRPTGNPASPEPSYRESRFARTVLPGIPLRPSRPTRNPASPEPSYRESRFARTVLPGIPLGGVASLRTHARALPPEGRCPKQRRAEAASR